MSRFLCIHGHFYQPPRENAWIEAIEGQESAYPFHDWNERISRECYRANGQSRILDEDGWVTGLSNNYSKISFNFGPTLLSWLEERDPETYEKILEGDRISRVLFGGHGAAIAQAYNHLILPLASRRDKETQVKWGVRDFQRRFGRDPESLWLPETAVDIETLEVMADHGMKYVILAPRQAKAVRALNSDGPWQDVSNEAVDSTQPYFVCLPSGNYIAAFFYNGSISKSIAFEGLLHNGESFAQHLANSFTDSDSRDELLHIATDGETYGHHHRFGDMALAYAIHTIESQNLVRITNYGQYLEMHVPTHEVQIHENSSWSCAHGVERWRSDCGCNSGGKPASWNQAWRAPLRSALDFVRDKVAVPWETAMSELCKFPWELRNAYVDLILDRSEENCVSFATKWCGRSLTQPERVKFLELLEIQRHLLLMYTSCAWFFDEVSGIETVQNIQYAYRAIELADELLNLELFPSFYQKLENTPSNLPELGNAATVLDEYVLPMKADLLKVAVHFGISSIFEKYQERNSIYCYDINLLEYREMASGRAKMGCGQAEIVSRITGETGHMTFGVIHFGDHTLRAGVRFFESKDRYKDLLEESKGVFGRADFPEVIQIFEKHFGDPLYSLKDLLTDERKKVTDLILSDSMKNIGSKFNEIYHSTYPSLRYLSNLHVKLPPVFENIATFVHYHGIKEQFERDGSEIEIDVIRRHLQEAKGMRGLQDQEGLIIAYKELLKREIDKLTLNDFSLESLRIMIPLVQLINELPFSLTLGTVKNAFYLWLLKHRSELFQSEPAKQRQSQSLSQSHFPSHSQEQSHSQIQASTPREQAIQELANLLMVRIPL